MIGEAEDCVERGWVSIQALPAGVQRLHTQVPPVESPHRRLSSRRFCHTWALMARRPIKSCMARYSNRAADQFVLVLWEG
jgi:hypothetical protein